MASTEFKHRRRAMALERMNIALARLSTKHDIPLFEVPRKTKDKDLREILVFEAVANVLEQVLGEDAPQLENHPLVILQANRGITEAPYKQGTATLTGNKVSKIDGTPKRETRVAAPRQPRSDKGKAKKNGE